MVWLSVFLLAVAVSFDALAIGITYGLNRISIPPWSKTVLSLVSGCTFLFTMVLGILLQRQLESRNTGVIGGLMFILLGLYNLWRNYGVTRDTRMLIDWHIPVLGLIIQVFQKPLSADADYSKHITGPEAFILGSALALDAIAAGFGAAVLALPILPTTISVMLASFLFVSWGLKIGAGLGDAPKQKHDWRWLPGTIILLLGIFKLFF